MKKFIALLMAALLICGTVGAAMAETSFYYYGTKQYDFDPWSSPATATGKNWHITWGANANMTSNRRAVIRVLDGDDQSTFASELWVYSSKSSAYHPYKDAWVNSGRKSCIGGHLDDRDSTTVALYAYGTFHN